MIISSNQLVYLTTLFIFCSQFRSLNLAFIWIIFFFLFVFKPKNFKSSILSVLVLILTVLSIDILIYLILKIIHVDLEIFFIDSFSRRIYIFNSSKIGLFNRGFVNGVAKGITNSYEILIRKKSLFINFTNLLKNQNLLTSIFLKGAIPDDLRVLLSMLGTSHILSPSSAHLSLILEFVSYLCRKRRINIISTIACTFYVLIVGSSSSTIRSLIGIYIYQICKIKRVNTHPIDRCIGSIIISAILFPGYIRTQGFGYSSLCSIAITSSLFISKFILGGRALIPLMFVMLSTSSYFVSLCWSDYINPLSFINTIIVNFALLALVSFDILKCVLFAIKMKKAGLMCYYMYLNTINLIKMYSVDAGFALFFDNFERYSFIISCSLMYISGIMLC